MYILIFLVSRAGDTAVWAVKMQCQRSQLSPLLSCTIADSALTLEVDDAATSVPSVSSPARSLTLTCTWVCIHAGLQ